MNTKLILSASAILLGLAGLVLSFAPAEVLVAVGLATDFPTPIFMQVWGALYLGMAVQNWMSKEIRIGGIYSRPLAMANFLHFAAGAMALGKGLVTHNDSYVLSIAATLYLLFAVLFGTIFFRHPVEADQKGNPSKP